MDKAVSRLARYCAEASRDLQKLNRSVPGVICRLRRIQSSRYEIGLQMQSSSGIELTYTTLVRF